MIFTRKDGMIIRVDWKLIKAVYFREYKGYRVYCQLYNSLIEDVQSDGIYSYC